MVIALIIIPVCIIATGFLVLKSVQLGLKWQVQVKSNIEPELKTPINTIIDAKERKIQAEQAKYMQDQIKEYMFGEEVSE